MWAPQAELESPWHPAWWPEGHSQSPVGIAVRPHCAPPLAEFRGAAARTVQGSAGHGQCSLASYYPSFIIITFWLHSLSLELCAEMYWVRAGTEEVGSVVCEGQGG